MDLGFRGMLPRVIYLIAEVIGRNEITKAKYCCGSVPKLCLTRCDFVDGNTPGPSVHHSQSLLKFMSFESVMLPSDG